MADDTDLDAIFERLETSFRGYAPPLVVRAGGVRGKRDCQLWSEKAVEIDGRKRAEVCFAGLIVQKSYVGFYFMPVHTDDQRRALFAPELLALLRGKSCFHVKRLDDELLGHVGAALEAGFELYRKRGWVDAAA
jgi:hypothetical protein